MCGDMADAWERDPEAGAVPSDELAIDRRAILRRGCSVAASALALSGGLAGCALRDGGGPPEGPMSGLAVRVLDVHNKPTAETERVLYHDRSGYRADGLARLDYLFRDHHSEEMISMDVRLYDLLFLLQNELGAHGRIQMLSGFRSARTNARLRRRYSGVARNSLHIKGQAADIRFPHLKAEEVAKTARSLKIGGVGFYRRAGFVHLDVGDVRVWNA